MKTKEPATKKSRFLSRLRDRFLRMLGRNKVILEPKEVQPTEPQPAKAKKEIPPAKIVELRPGQMRLELTPKERSQKRSERRTKRRTEQQRIKQEKETKGRGVDRNGFRILDDVSLRAEFGEEDEPEENFEEILEQSLADTSMQNVLAEKEPEPDDPQEATAPKEPQDEVDLHRMKAEEAKQTIFSFIHTSRQAGYRLVRIITGKGLHSEDGISVLRTIAEEMMEMLKKEGQISGFKWESGKKERSGAMIIYLK